VPAKRAHKLTVLQALTNHSWISDIQGAFSVGVLVEFLNLWGLLFKIVLQPAVEVCTVGVFHVLEFTQPSQHMRDSFKDLFSSGHVTVFGTLGLPAGVISLCGLWLINVVGQRINFENGDCHILTDVLTVRRLKKLLIICLLIVCLQDNSGHTSTMVWLTILVTLSG
jgi:hypothetical protein